MTRRSLRNVLRAAALTLAPALVFAQAADGGPNYLIIVGGVAVGLIVVSLVLITIARVYRLRYETIRTFAEKGQPIPEQLLGTRHLQFPAREKPTLEELRGYALGWGVLLSFLGVGVGLANYLSSGEIRSAAWGLIFLFVGLGQLTNSAIIHYTIRRQAKSGG